MTPVPEPLPGSAAAIEAHGLVLRMEGWEGPLEALLELARARRIDLARISITALVDQYLTHVEGAGRPRLEIAAEYLVMAAWLAFLKSASLLPAEPEPDPEPEALAAEAAHRANRLAAMRDAAALLALRPRFNQDRHARAAPEGLAERTRASPTANLHLLLAAYGRVRARADARSYAPRRRAVVTMADALAALTVACRGLADWTPLSRLLAAAPPALTRSSRASGLAAALELARTRKVELRQAAAFAPLEVRAR